MLRCLISLACLHELDDLDAPLLDLLLHFYMNVMLRYLILLVFSSTYMIFYLVSSSTQHDLVFGFRRYATWSSIGFSSLCDIIFCVEHVHEFHSYGSCLRISNVDSPTFFFGDVWYYPHPTPPHPDHQVQLKTRHVWYYPHPTPPHPTLTVKCN